MILAHRLMLDHQQVVSLNLRKIIRRVPALEDILEEVLGEVVVDFHHNLMVGKDNHIAVVLHLKIDSFKIMGF